MSALLVGDARCSTDQRDLTAQRDALLGLGVESERIYVDHGLTGTNRERPGLREALAAPRTGDTLVVTKPDRLARPLPDARAIAPSTDRSDPAHSHGCADHQEHPRCDARHSHDPAQHLGLDARGHHRAGDGHGQLHRLAHCDRQGLGVVLVTDALHERVARFYETLGFRRIPASLLLVQKTADIEAALRSPD